MDTSILHVTYYIYSKVARGLKFVEVVGSLVGRSIFAVMSMESEWPTTVSTLSVPTSLLWH